MRTPLDVHRNLVSVARARGWPEPPLRPAAGECCERGCEPCVWDYYERALGRWRARHADAA